MIQTMMNQRKLSQNNRGVAPLDVPLSPAGKKNGKCVLLQAKRKQNESKTKAKRGTYYEEIL